MKSESTNQETGQRVGSTNLLEAEHCECTNWAREINLKYLTNHHLNCEHYNDSLIDVWKMTVDGETSTTDREQDIIDWQQNEFPDEVTVIKEKMHREVYENLPEFKGF